MKKAPAFTACRDKGERRCWTPPLATSGEIPEPGNPPGARKGQPGIVAALLRTEMNCTGWMKLRKPKAREYPIYVCAGKAPRVAGTRSLRGQEPGGR